jgi:hypothetical protein
VVVQAGDFRAVCKRFVAEGNESCFRDHWLAYFFPAFHSLPATISTATATAIIRIEVTSRIMPLRPTGLSVSHRKHITSPLQTQQINAIYRFVTMIYYYNYHNSGHYPSSCLLFKTQLI